MVRIAEKKENLKSYFHQYECGFITLGQITQKFGVSQAYILRVFKEFRDALNEACLDQRGRKKAVPQVNKELEAEIQQLKKERFLLQKLVEYLLLFITFIGNELGVKYLPFQCRLSGEIKKFLLQALLEYEQLGGALVDFAQRFGKNPATLKRWLTLHEQEKDLNNHRSSGRPPKIYPEWVKRKISALKRKYPQAKAGGLSKLFNSLSTSVKLTPYAVEKILIEEQERISKLREKNRKRFNFPELHASWDIDFLEFTVNEARQKALIVVEHYSRQVLYAKIMVQPTAQKVAQVITSLCQHHNCKPVFIKADNGPEFREQFQKSLQRLGIHLLSSPFYYPQFNGVVERINREIRKHFTLTNVIVNIDKLLRQFQDYHNYLPHQTLGGLSPQEIFRKGCSYEQKENIDLVIPYLKNHELRIKFSKRNGKRGRLTFSLP